LIPAAHDNPIANQR